MQLLNKEFVFEINSGIEFSKNLERRATSVGQRAMVNMYAEIIESICGWLDTNEITRFEEYLVRDVQELIEITKNLPKHQGY